MITLSRRGFLAALGIAPLATLPAVDLWTPRKKIFLPPRVGWPLAGAHVLLEDVVFLEDAAFSLEMETRTLYGWEQVPVLARGHMRVLASGRVRAAALPRWRQDALLTLDNKVDGVLLFPNAKFRILSWEKNFAEPLAYVTLEQVL